MMDAARPPLLLIGNAAAPVCDGDGCAVPDAPAAAPPST